jgi:DNA (cytosine-5)-methyltransferase 1
VGRFLRGFVVASHPEGLTRERSPAPNAYPRRDGDAHSRERHLWGLPALCGASQKSLAEATLDGGAKWGIELWVSNYTLPVSGSLAMEQLPTAIDLFCGAGGASQGLREAGIRVLAAVDNDRVACSTFRANHQEVALSEGDLLHLSPSSVRQALGLARGALTILKTCPPCQPYSRLSRARDTTRGDSLLLANISWIEEFRPAAVILENVTGVKRSPAFTNLREWLSLAGYQTTVSELNATQFGVSQSRCRLFLVALRSGVEPLPSSFWRSVDEPLPHAAELLAATTPAEGDELNRFRVASGVVLARIRAIPVNGSRFDLPPELRLSCHNRLKAHVATTAYSRMSTTGPAPTLTTRCTTPSCGKFIHPRADRGLTLREAAILQSFPLTYRFLGNYGEIERQIGNAVPVRVVRILAERLLAHLNNNGGDPLE